MLNLGVHNGQGYFLRKPNEELKGIEKKDYKLKCATIENMFKYKSKEYYTKEDWNRGYIGNTNKHGAIKKYPLIEVRSERVV